MIQAALSKWIGNIKAISGYSQQEAADLIEGITADLHGQSKRALNTHVRKLVDISGADRTVNGVTSDRILISTGSFTNARRGSIVRFLSGANIYEEVSILSKIDDNSVILSHKQDAAYAANDTFRVYKAITEVLTASGAPQATITTTDTNALARVNLKFFGNTVNDTTYRQLLADSGNTEANKIEIFLASGVPMYLAFGGAGSEVDQIIIIPGQNKVLDLTIPANTRLSLKAVDTGASEDGQDDQGADDGSRIIVNLFG